MNAEHVGSPPPSAPSQGDGSLTAHLYDMRYPPGRADEPVYAKALEALGDRTALEAGCGTGRLLLPYLAAGHKVEGLDSSPPMLARCRERAAGMGLAPTLHAGLMEDFDLGRSYGLIYVPFNSFSLLEDEERALAALRRFRAHLEPKGRLLLSVFAPPREPLHEEEPRQVLEVSLSDGRLLRLFEVMEDDEAAKTRRIGLDHRLLGPADAEGKRPLLRREVQLLRLRWFDPATLLGLLARTGFVGATISGPDGESMATREDAEWIVSARRHDREEPA